MQDSKAESISKPVYTLTQGQGTLCKFQISKPVYTLTQGQGTLCKFQIYIFDNYILNKNGNLISLYKIFNYQVIIES